MGGNKNQSNLICEDVRSERERERTKEMRRSGEYEQGNKEKAAQKGSGEVIQSISGCGQQM